MKERVLGVIPARGGSKTIPRKNIRDLLGIPLIAYTIREALKAKTLTRLIVSSEDSEILAVARKYGAETPFVRPRELATDDSLTIDVVIHAITTVEEQEGTKYNYVVVLQPTTPLRTAEDIDTAVMKLIESGADSVISIVNVGAIHPYRMKTIVNGLLVDYADEEIENMPRQKLPPVYIRNGSIYATKRDVLVEERTFKGKTCIPYEMPEERSVNIDNKFDLMLAESLLRAKYVAGQ